MVSLIAVCLVVIAVAVGAGWSFISATAPPESPGAAAPTASLVPTAALQPTASASASASLPAAADDALRGPVLPVPPAELRGYAWPIHDARLTNAFGVGRPGAFLQAGTTVHDGIDIASFCGAPITAAHDGIVLAAGRGYDEYLGWLGDLTAYRTRLDTDNAWSTIAIAVVIDDGNGYRSIYAHLRKAVVKAGQAVRAGDLLGYEGATGNATGCHLHFGLFSPDERATYDLDPKVAARTKLPPREIARIDPLLVLPPLDSAGITWGWGARDQP